jgi:hypothetical protein
MSTGMVVDCEYEGRRVTANVVRFSHHGFLAEIAEIPWKVGSYMMLNFTIAELKRQITCRGRSIKHYERIPSQSGNKEGFVKLVEIHFTGLSGDDLKLVRKYAIRKSIESKHSED